MKNFRNIILTAIALLAAGCASDKAAVPSDELPLTELPPSNGENMFKGNVFKGSVNYYDFTDDNTLTVYQRLQYNGTDDDYVEVGKDWYSYDNEKGELYTKVISVFDPDTKRVFSNASEYEDYLIEIIEKNLNEVFESENSLIKTPEEKKYMSEYVKTQCRSLAAQTFSEVVVNKFALYLDQRMLVLEDIPTYYISRTHNFITDKNSGEYFVSLNSLQFQTGKAELLDSNKVGYFYDGVPYGDDGTSFSVDLYRFEMDANGTCYSVAKTGLLKAEYTTIKDEKSVTKKLHFTVLPKEIKDLSDADVSYKIEKKTSTYTY